jgi:hypothetical protein
MDEGAGRAKSIDRTAGILSGPANPAVTERWQAAPADRARREREWPAGKRWLRGTLCAPLPTGRPRETHPDGGMGIPRGFDLTNLKPTCGARSQGARSHPISPSRLFVMVTWHYGHRLARVTAAARRGAKQGFFIRPVTDRRIDCLWVLLYGGGRNFNRHDEGRDLRPGTSG